MDSGQVVWMFAGSVTWHMAGMEWNVSWMNFLPAAAQPHALVPCFLLCAEDARGNGTDGWGYS